MQMKCPIHSVSQVTYQERVSSPGSIRVLSILALLFLNVMIFPKESDAADNCKKWFPGHYVYLFGNSDFHWNKAKGIVDRAGSTAATNGTPQHFKGYVVTHRWRDLEPTEGHYDFSAIEAQLNKAESEGRKLKVSLDEREYGEMNGECLPAVPAYMRSPDNAGGTDTANIYEGGEYLVAQEHTNRFSTRYARLWVAAVAERYGALLKAFGERYDNHPALAMAFERESALNEGTQQTGWSKIRYIDGRQIIARRAAEAFPHTPFVVFTNDAMALSRDQTADWFDEVHVDLYHHGFGAPNPQNPARQWKSDPMADFGFAYDKFNGKVPISMAFQDNWDRSDPKTFIDHMVQEEHVNSIDWFPITALGGDKNAVFTIYDAINQIQTPGYISYNAAVPSDYTACGEPPPPPTNLRVQ